MRTPQATTAVGLETSGIGRDPVPSDRDLQSAGARSPFRLPPRLVVAPSRRASPAAIDQFRDLGDERPLIAGLAETELTFVAIPYSAQDLSPRRCSKSTAASLELHDGDRMGGQNQRLVRRPGPFQRRDGHGLRLAGDVDVAQRRRPGCARPRSRRRPCPRPSASTRPLPGASN